jgi:DNA-directed RNA polymerase specialized sigma24 family protein
MVLFFTDRKKGYTDAEVVVHLQRRDEAVERWFYETSKRYFDKSFNEIFFDADRKQEVFQLAFIKLWTEIEDKKIKLIDGKLVRQQRSGGYEPMSCSLTTFLMAFARNEHREIVRNIHEGYYEELFDSADCKAQAVSDDYDDAEDIKNSIVDECIHEMSPGCVEILTMFYYEGKSLDDIMEARGEKNTSKNGLKTAKNKCMNTLKERVIERYKEYNK